jgi:hypothetical protein
VKTFDLLQILHKPTTSQNLCHFLVGYLEDVLPMVLWDAHLVTHLQNHVFKIIEESHLLQELALIAKDPSLLVNSKCFQWGNIILGGSHMNNCIGQHKMGHELKIVATRFIKHI